MKSAGMRRPPVSPRGPISASTASLNERVSPHCRRHQAQCEAARKAAERERRVGLLCLGKSDFEAVNGVREDDYFAESLAVPQVPSEGTLRQRMDAHAPRFLPLVQDAAIDKLDAVV